VLPEYVYTFSKDLSVGLYGGVSIGFGTEQLSVNERSQTLIDSTYRLSSDDPLYEDYNIGSFRVPYSVNIGSSIYYKWLMIDVRYRYTDINNLYSSVQEFHNVSFQVGVVLE
jgi:hypothetical protein